MNLNNISFRILNFHLNLFSFKQEPFKHMEINFFKLSDIFSNFNNKFSSFNYININSNINKKKQQ